jgi:hypothetical protein
VGDLGVSSTSRTGTLSTTFTLPSPFEAADPTAVCPPTQAQVNTGEVGCSLNLATFTDVSYGSVTLQYTGQPTPQAPTLALSPTSTCPGRKVTVSDGAGPGQWWGNPETVTPLSSADISIGPSTVAGRGTDDKDPYGPISWSHDSLPA